MSPAILLDDSALSINFNLLGNTWQRKTGQSGAYNGTVSVWTPSSDSTFPIIPPELELFFYGTDINVYGTVSNGVAGNYTIDETTLRAVNFPTGLPDGKTGVNLFSLSGLTEVLYHNFQLFPSKGQFIFDFLTYTPNTDTLLSGLDIILDDPDVPLQYSSGQWNHTTGDFTAGRPYNGTMTGSSTPGATMKLSFEGSDISVYGLLNQVAGQLAVSFSVDGQTPTVFNPFNGSQTVNASSWKVSQQFFHMDLAPGSHSLLVTLTNVTGNQALWIDSVVYEATSQTTLAGISAPVTSSGSGGGGPFGGGGGSGSTFPKAAIAGIAAGAFILALICFKYARRQCASPPARIIPITIPPPAPPIHPTSPPPWAPWHNTSPPMYPQPMNEPNWNQNWQQQQPVPMNNMHPPMPEPFLAPSHAMRAQDGANEPALRRGTDIDGINEPASRRRPDMDGGYEPAPQRRPDMDGANDPASQRRTDMDGGYEPTPQRRTDMDGANADERSAPPAAERVNRAQEDGRD